MKGYCCMLLARINYDRLLLHATCEDYNFQLLFENFDTL